MGGASLQIAYEVPTSTSVLSPQQVFYLLGEFSGQECQSLRRKGTVFGLRPNGLGPNVGSDHCQLVLSWVGYLSEPQFLRV